MSGINKVILVGHVGKDPEFKVLEGEIGVLSFPLATSDHVMKDGIRVDQTEWHNIIMWRGLAEAGLKLLKKNTLVYLEGKIRTRSFMSKDGLKKYVTEIVIDQFTLLGRKSDFDESVDLKKMDSR